LNTTKLIVLHADNLIMTTFSMSVNARRMEAEFFFCPASSQWAFMMDEEVHAGDFIDLGIEFQGEVLPDLQGLYISTHTDSRGRKTKSAVTQFEPSYARKMFPCFDEPNFKATFEVSVIREPHHVVRSNMKMKLSEEHVDGLYIDVFHRTVKMSTYLLAVAILDNYDYVKRTTKSTKAPIEVRLYAPKDVIKGQAEFGLDTAIRSLEFFENYFDIPYPLDKIDLLALDDFSEGAMENWGLITFRDSTLLHAEGIASALAKEQIALVICHEIAHQWFGNLVTMNWWNDLWLNEGFANYMEYRCVDKLFPDWNIMTRFYVENVAFSQEPDGLRSSRAVSTHTSNETNIMGLFDAISYHKAAAIIRMLQSLSGERNFQRSLIQYLNKYAYGNAKGSQLWKIVEKHAVLPHGVSIASLATAYITQVGCPMIYVTLSNNEIIIHNQVIPFFLRKCANQKSQPIKNDCIGLPANYVAWPLVEHSKWVIANTGGFSYVKVLYDKKNYAALAKQLRTNHRAISSIDRSMILNDAFDFAKTSKLDIGVYLDLLLYAEEEMDRLPWTLISKQVQYIEDLIEDTSFGHIFKVEILEMACRLRHRDCIKQAHNRYNDWITKKKRPSPELLGVVLDEGVRQGGVAAWERAYAAYLEAKSPSEKYQLIGAMASTTHPSLISRLLRLSIEGSSFRPNVIPRMLSDLTKNEAARALTWRFFRVNYKEFVRMLVKRLPECVLFIDSKRDKKPHFLKKSFLEDNKARLNQLFEQIELNIQWRRLNERPLRKWLENWDEERRVIQRRRRHHKHRHH
uniref:Aminopeptidase n=1 Tax=Haemonchus placei TaxID=6290 RepID=A0A0N4WPD1_HAEPC